MSIGHRRLEGWEVTLVVLLGLGTLALGLFRLTAYPAPWFDEGWYLQIARNLAHYGQYATLSSEGFRYDDTALAVAPTLYLPIALVFRLAGVGLLQARLAMVAGLLVAVAVFYLTARSVHGFPIAAAAAYLFLLQMEDDPFTSTVYMGRQVMAEVPALLFFLLGSLLWFRALRGPRRRWGEIAAGLLFGLAMVTKLQYVFFIPPALLLTALLARVLWKRSLWKPALISLACGLGLLLLWYGILRLIVGPENFASLLTGLSTASSPQVRVFSLARLGESARFLLRSHFLLFALPGLLYGLVTAVRRGPEETPTLFLGLFILAGLGWYVLASIGWPRYTYPFLALGNLFTARLLYDIGDRFARPARNVRALAVLLILLILPLAQFRLIARDLLSPPDSGFAPFTRYIQTQVPPGRVIETWEWEVTFVDEAHRYHIPPTSLLNRLIAHVYFGAPYAPEEYDFQEADPDYVVVGRFARWTNLYPQEFLEQDCRLVVTMGEYQLFEVMAQ